MSTILKALRRLEEDDAKSREADGEDRVADGAASSGAAAARETLPASAYAAADELANAASPARSDVPVESRLESLGFDRALSLARSRAVLAVATTVGLVALTYGAISMRESGGGLLNQELTTDPSPATSRAATPPARVANPAARAARPPVSRAAPIAEAPREAAAPQNQAVAVAVTAAATNAVRPTESASEGAPGSDGAATGRAPVPARASTTPSARDSQVSSVSPPAAKPMRSRPTEPTKPARSVSKPARDAELVSAAVTPTRSAAASAAATAQEEITKATQAISDAPRRPRAEQLTTPAPVSAAEPDASLPIAKTWPVTRNNESSRQNASSTPSVPSERTTPIAPSKTSSSTSSVAGPNALARAAENLTPLEQARAMEAAASSTGFSVPPARSAPPRQPVRSAESASVRTPEFESAASTVKPAPIAQQAAEVERLDRRGLPDVRVLRTSWHPQSDRRTAQVRVDAQYDVLTLREGDAVGGLVVQAISPSSVLFEAGGIEIRRRVGGGR